MSTHAYGPKDAEDHVCDCGHPWDDHDLTRGCQSLACTCSPEAVTPPSARDLMLAAVESLGGAA